MHVIVSIKRLTIPWGTSVVVCTDLGGNELQRQVGMGIVVTSGNLNGVMVAHWPGMQEIWVRFTL